MMRWTIALFACIAPCWISTPLQSAEVFGAWNLAYDTKAHTAERTERDARWVAECKPRLVTDENGVRRYVYAQDDCAGKIVRH
jgi:hypothetical protein